MALIVDIKKQYGRFSLQASFTAENGTTGLLGASGSGKSLTLRCIAGIESPDSGYIELDGRVLFDSARRINLSPQQRRVGYLFQHYALFPNMTTEQNIAAGLCRKDQNNQKLGCLIEAFSLEQCQGKYPHQLSGGQQQRVALARILAGEPAALLLDEPFSALDRHLKWQVELALSQRLTSFSGPVLFVSHDESEIFRQCKQVCVLSHGATQPIQTVQQLFDAPNTLASCRLSGCQNLSRARALSDGMVQAIDWGVVLHCDRPLPAGLSHLGIRAEEIRLAEGPGVNRVCCSVLQMQEERSSIALLLASPAGRCDRALLRVELLKHHMSLLGAFTQCWIELPPSAILLLSGT